MSGSCERNDSERRHWSIRTVEDVGGGWLAPYIRAGRGLDGEFTGHRVKA